VKILHAHYWDVNTNQIVQLYKMAKAVFTGVPPKMGNEGDCECFADSTSLSKNIERNI